MSEEVPGFSTAAALIPHLVRVELVREGPWPAGESIRMPAEVFTLLQPHAARWDREHFLTVLLDDAHRIVGIDDVAVGCVRSCPVHPREVFKAAILANAAAIIVAHNHPSGEATPLIVTGSTFYSFNDHGLIGHRWQPPAS